MAKFKLLGITGAMLQSFLDKFISEDKTTTGEPNKLIKSNIMDTITPSFANGDYGTTVSFNKYYRMGAMVFYTFRITINTITTPGTGSRVDINLNKSIGTTTLTAIPVINARVQNINETPGFTALTVALGDATRLTFQYQDKDGVVNFPYSSLKVGTIIDVTGVGFLL